MGVSGNEIDDIMRVLHMLGNAVQSDLNCHY